ncbi:hypothetical protein ACLM5J_08450 [Nocardioides sp. Bht2]|uniref:hypothetical protein n=1 Tax=Nocardioides sp. Bht2 TaxID=3392297 RepID=UPI0039B46863
MGFLVLVAWATLASVVVPAPAQAHPFGPPQQAAVDRAPGEQNQVRVRWRVGGTDDLTLLGISLGLLPESRRMMDGAVFFNDADAEALIASPLFADYLLDQVRVTAAGVACPGRVDDVTQLATSGVTLLFACAEEPTEPEVTIKLLTDLHPEYRTLATGPDGQRAVYADGAQTHGWTLTASGQAEIGSADAGSAGRSAAIQLGAVFGGGFLLTLGAVFGRRRWLRVRR